MLFRVTAPLDNRPCEYRGQDTDGRKYQCCAASGTPCLYPSCDASNPNCFVTAAASLGIY